MEMETPMVKRISCTTTIPILKNVEFRGEEGSLRCKLDWEQYAPTAQSSPTIAPTTLGVATSNDLVAITKDKGARAIVELEQLSILTHTYHVQFMKYSTGCKKVVTQMVPIAVWKNVYAMNMAKYVDNML